MDSNVHQGRGRGAGRSFRGSFNRGNQRQQLGAPVAGQAGERPPGHWSNGNGNRTPTDRGRGFRGSRDGRGRGGFGGAHGGRGYGQGGGDEMAALNFENIRRLDPSMKCIIDQSSQVAIFTYTDNRWNEALAVGSLFMYERNGNDRLGMVIMNRQSVENWIHPITKKLELVVEPPYWLVKDDEAIFCIWFYDANDIFKLANIFRNFNHSVITNETGNRIRSGLKPPNLMASVGAETGLSLGDSILAMLTKSKTEKAEETAARDPENDLLRLISKLDPTKIEDPVAHPLPIKPEPVKSPQQAFKESPKSKVQLRTSGASSFAEVAAGCKKENNWNTTPATDQRTERSTINEDEGGAAAFTMQTVEQLEKENQIKKEGPNLGGHGFITHEHLAQQESPQSEPEKAHQKMTNDLRAKLGLPPCVYSVSPDADAREGGTEQYYSDEDNRFGPSVSHATPSRSQAVSGYVDSPWPKTKQGTPLIWSPKTTNTEPAQGKPVKEGFSGFKLPKPPGSRVPAKLDPARNLRFQSIDDIHGKEIYDVEPHELQHILTTHGEEVKNLKLMPSPGKGADDTKLVWTNVARQTEYELTSRPSAPMYSAQTVLETKNIVDLPLTADQLVKTFKLLLRDKEFVTKFHNAYLQARSEEGL